VPVIFTSAKPDLRDVVDTLKAGAFDFFEKPFETAALANRV
jgi:FixJ family two-component response regulator